MANKLVTLPGDAVKVMLLSAYTVGTTQDTAQFVSDVLAVATEAVGTGYTAGGQALVSPTYAETNASHLYTYTTATNPVWTTTGGTLTAMAAVFYDSTPGTAATNPLLCYWDLGGNQTSSNGTFTLTIAAGGILTLTGA